MNRSSRACCHENATTRPGVVLERFMLSCFRDRRGAPGWAAVLLFAATTLSAQNRSATVSGIVRDGTGAVLPGATVTVRAVATNQTRHTVSDERGRYAFPNQDIGVNEIVAELTGFQPARVTLELTVG